MMTDGHLYLRQCRPLLLGQEEKGVTLHSSWQYYYDLAENLTF
ncbi:hypothetical protein F750_7146 (plasmid) [Streptomyces sp. PAMC 26508]|nr:hypothetical protein [Streptomyces sp. PAMC 26508]AGJ59570.1 hypothetical protein F750_7146 [Streptomyces sp. PAMC 26508]